MKTNSFHVGEALLLAQASLDAYSPGTAAFLREMDFKTAVITQGAFQALVHSRPGHVIVAFRGTYNSRDFLADAEIIQKHFHWAAPDSARVHEGFSNALQGLWDRLLEALPPDIANCRLEVTGHSLGAAMAILLAARLQCLGHAPSLVVGFGCPRVGNKDFCRWYDNKLGNVTFRVNHVDDPIALVPFCLGAYREQGQHVLLTSSRTFILNPGLVLESIRTVRAFMADIARCRGILVGHKCERYVHDMCMIYSHL